MKIILKDMRPDDWVLGVRAAKWLMDRFQQDAVISYGERPNAIDLYVKRNKSSITVRPCNGPTKEVEERPLACLASARAT